MDKNLQQTADPLNHVIEECLELMKECFKAKRFGLRNHHPTDRPELINMTRIDTEFNDICDALQRLREEFDRGYDG